MKSDQSITYYRVVMVRSYTLRQGDQETCKEKQSEALHFNSTGAVFTKHFTTRRTEIAIKILAESFLIFTKPQKPNFTQELGQLLN